MRLNSKDLKVQKLKCAFILIPRQQCLKSGSNLDIDLGMMDILFQQYLDGRSEYEDYYFEIIIIERTLNLLQIEE